jgi:hypothetical protein
LVGLSRLANVENIKNANISISKNERGPHHCPPTAIRTRSRTRTTPLAPDSSLGTCCSPIFMTLFVPKLRQAQRVFEKRAFTRIKDRDDDLAL